MSRRKAPKLGKTSILELTNIGTDASEEIKATIIKAIDCLCFGTEERRAMHRVLMNVLLMYAVVEAMQDDVSIDQLRLLLSDAWNSVSSKVESGVSELSGVA